jgi:hypothetical protein
MKFALAPGNTLYQQPCVFVNQNTQDGSPFALNNHVLEPTTDSGQEAMVKP